MKKRIPKKPTRELIAEAAKLVKLGAPLDLTARLLLGAANQDRFFLWLAIASDPNVEPQLLRRGIYKDLLAAVDKASAECELRQIAVVQKGQQPRWAAWFLSRRHPQRWGDRAVLEVTTTPESQKAFAERIKEIRERAFDPRALPEGAPPPFDAPLAERLAYLREHTPDPRSLPPADEPGEVVVPPRPKVEILEPLDVVEEVSRVGPRRRIVLDGHLAVNDAVEVSVTG